MLRHISRSLSCAILACAALSQFAAPASASLVGYWRFSAADPVGVAVDSAGTAQNGTFNGGAQSSIQFDGTRGNVLDLNPGSPGTEGGFVTTSTLPSMTDTSWMLWVNLRSATNATGGFPMFMTSAPGGTYEFRFTGTSRQPEIINGGGIVLSGTPLALNTWHHIAHVQSGAGANNFTMYVDGVSVGTGSGTPWGGNRTIDFGHRTSGNHHFNGRLDEAQVWNQALSVGKVRALMNPVFDLSALAMEQLFSVYDAQTGSYMTGEYNWTYTTGLSIGEGNSLVNGSEAFLQLDALGNGLFGLAALAIPEPGSCTLLGFAAAALAWQVRRRRRG